MYKLFNVKTCESNDNPFQSREAANEAACLWSEEWIGIVIVIDTTNGKVSDVWEDGYYKYELK